MEISVIVPSLNEEDCLEACLKSIIRQSFPRNEYEIIVSDGRSKDKTIEIAKKYADKVVFSRKRGIWFGRNFGAKFAKGKYFVFIDADTIIEKDYLKTIHKYLENGCVGVSSAFRFSGNCIGVRIMELSMNSYFMLDSLLNRTCLVGFNLGTAKKAFLEIGGFKEGHLEDVKISDDLRKIGRTRYLKTKMVLTSSRRFERFGTFEGLRYYMELFLVHKSNTAKGFHKKLKYSRYLHTNDMPGPNHK